MWLTFTFSYSPLCAAYHAFTAASSVLALVCNCFANELANTCSCCSSSNWRTEAVWSSLRRRASLAIALSWPSSPAIFRRLGPAAVLRACSGRPSSSASNSPLVIFWSPTVMITVSDGSAAASGGSVAGAVAAGGCFRGAGRTRLGCVAGCVAGAGVAGCLVGGGGVVFCPNHKRANGAVIRNFVKTGNVIWFPRSNGQATCARNTRKIGVLGLVFRITLLHGQ